MSGALDVLALGEPMVLLDPAERGPIEAIDDYRMRVAGAELNTLIGLSRLGHEVALITTLGRDPFGRRIRRTLEEEDVRRDFVGEDARRTGLYFKEHLDESRRVHYYREGSAASATSPAAVAEALRVARPRVILTSGLNLGLGGPGGMRDAVLTFLEHGARSGARVVFDANLREGIWSGDQAAADFAAIAPLISCLLVGEDELATLLSPAGRAQDVLELGIDTVFVKHGAVGATVVDASGETFVPARPADAVDSIGAGDAFAAGVISGLLRGLDPRECAELGAILGARAVEGTGDWETLPFAAELEIPT